LDRVPTTRTGLFSNAIYVVTIGTALASVIGLFIGVIISEDLFGMISLTSIEDLGSFIAILLSWVVAAAVAGFRAKSAIRGAAAAFLGTVLGAFIIGFFLTGIIVLDINWILLGTGELITINESKMGTLGPFFTGIVLLLIASMITGFATGSLVKEKPVQRKLGRSTKTWESGKHKSKWKCSKCKAPIPAGAMVCPKCRTPVIE
jgi:hypothetical protein